MIGKSLAILSLGLGVLLGYMLRAAPVSAQPDAMPFSIGASVRLTVENFPSGVSTIPCKVSGAHNEFIGCERDEGQRQPRWINLRYVQEITHTPER